MTTSYHTPILSVPNQIADADTFNAPLSQLDTQIVANTVMATAVANEVYAARGGQSSLDARLDGITAIGSNVSTNANGTASAGQKIVVVDASAGFLSGAPVAYALAGGAIETNTVDMVDSPTQLTMINVIGTGGIPNDGYITVINPGTLMSTGAVNGATAQQQRFTKGVFLGGNASLVADDAALLIGRSAVNPLGSGGSHAVRDESTYYYAGGGYASFDSNPEVGGAGGMNHVVSFQSRPNYSGAGLLDAMWGIDFLPIVNGPVTNIYGAYILDPLGAGSIDFQAGLYIAPLTRATANYGIYVAGNNPTYLGGGVLLGGSTGAVWGGTALTAAVTDAFGVRINNPGVSGAGAITNLYGLYISTLSRGSGTNYGLYVEGNQSYFGGNVRIDGPLFHNGSTAGFFGTAAIAKPTGVAVSAAGIHAALVALGLIGA